MRILFLAFQFPYPPISGAAIKTLSLIDYLRRDHELHLSTLRRGQLTEQQVQWAAGIESVQTVDLNKPRNLRTLLSSYIAGVPLRIERNRSPELARLAREAVESFQPEVLFCDGLSTAQYVPSGFRGTTLLHEHNAEYVIWQRQSEIEKGPLRWVAASEAVRLKRYEAATIRRFDRVFAVSDADRRLVVALGADERRVGVLPNIPDPALLDQPAPAFADTEPVILYFGTLSWQPNIEGLMRVLTSIFPAVRKTVPDARLIVAGAGASRALRERVHATDGAEFRGRVEDPEPLYREARVLVDATRSGGGTRLKVLNSLARGVPVVASDVAAEGIDAVNGKHLLIVDSDERLADAITSLLQAKERWQTLSQNGRALVRARYIAEVAYQPLDDALAVVASGAK
jgi:glycosyltransferase involved in cell wall biosynthesis